MQQGEINLAKHGEQTSTLERPDIISRIRAKFRSQQHEAIVNLLRSASDLRDHLGRTLGPYGLTLEQYSILRIMRGAGDPGISVHQIRDRMITRVPAITRLLDKMEAKGLLFREREVLDRRQVNCSLSDYGRQTLAELDAQVDAADVAAMAGLTESEMKQLIALLTKVRGVCGVRDVAVPAIRNL